LKYAELFQTGLPVCALSATVGSIKLEGKKKNMEGKLPPGTKKWMNVYLEQARIRNGFSSYPAERRIGCCGCALIGFKDLTNLHRICCNNLEHVIIDSQHNCREQRDHSIS
jgi:hypothetical protein